MKTRLAPTLIMSSLYYRMPFIGGSPIGSCHSSLWVTSMTYSSGKLIYDWRLDDHHHRITGTYVDGSTVVFINGRSGIQS